jgi:hypothetical protein
LASIRTGPASPLTSALPQSGGDSRVHSRSPPVTLHSIKELYDAHVGRGPDLHVCCHGLRGDTLPLPVLFVLRCSRRHAPHLHDNPQCVTANGRLSKRGVSSRSWCLRYVPTWARRRPTLVFDAEDFCRKNRQDNETLFAKLAPWGPGIPRETLRPIACRVHLYPIDSSAPPFNPCACAHQKPVCPDSTGIPWRMR